jgi:cell division protein FtsI/penicillin-binding protein 2
MAWMSDRPKQGARRAFSRFDRRVGALAVLALGVLCILSLQLMRLSVVEHSVHRTNVERFLVTKRLLPAPRGRILDRRGEVLAADRASWDVLIAYDAIAGRWASDMARRELVAELGRSRWLELSAGERAAALLERQRKFDGIAARRQSSLPNGGRIRQRAQGNRSVPHR